MSGITRREVLATSVAALAAAPWVTAEARTSQTIRTLYDPRFPQARSLAAALPGGAQLESVGGDPSHLLLHLMAHEPGEGVLRLQGVTTESVPFCLEQFARSRHEVRFESRRIDRDLFAWSLRITARAPA